MSEHRRDDVPAQLNVHNDHQERMGGPLQRHVSSVPSLSSFFPLIKLFQPGLYAEDAPPADIADRLAASYPHHMGVGIGQRATKYIAELDKRVSLLPPLVIILKTSNAGTS